MQLLQQGVLTPLLADASSCWYSGELTCDAAFALRSTSEELEGSVVWGENFSSGSVTFTLRILRALGSVPQRRPKYTMPAGASVEQPARTPRVAILCNSSSSSCRRTEAASKMKNSSGRMKHPWRLGKLPMPGKAFLPVHLGYVSIEVKPEVSSKTKISDPKVRHPRKDCRSSSISKARVMACVETANSVENFIIQGRGGRKVNILDLRCRC